ncbi:MAG TPA: ABC transporter permease [Streptosporangiales bacterium]
MLKTTLAGLRAHKARLLFSSLAIILGVGFAAGSFVLTDTIRQGYYASFAADAQRVDLVVQADGDGSTVPVATQALVRGVSGVRVAEGRYKGHGTLLNAQGRPAAGSGNALVDSVAGEKSLRWQKIAHGRMPGSDDELVLDAAAAKHNGYAIGDTVHVVDAGNHVRSYTLVGTVDTENSPQYANVPYIGVVPSQAKLLTGSSGYSRIDVQLDAGADRNTVERAVEGVLPSGTRAYTATAYADQQIKQIASELAQIRIGLLAFAAIAMFVAAIVIANTFTILIAQRTREMALLRCVGATRGQVYRSVVLESTVLGVVGSALGVLAGIGLAAGAQAVLNAVGASIGDVTVSPSAVGLVLPFVLGLVVTVVAAAFPALGATRIPPIAALRNQPEPRRARRAGRVRTILAVLLVAGGCAAMWPGTFADKGSQELFLFSLVGGAVAFLGILLLTPVLVPLLIRVVGLLLALPFRTPGKLARANAVRNPGRAASTSAALLVGVTLISIMTVTSASLGRTATAGLDKEFPFDIAVNARQGAVPSGVVTALEQEKDFSSTLPVRSADGTMAHAGTVDVQGVDAAKVRQTFGAGLDYGKASPGRVVIPKVVAHNAKLAVGDRVSIRFRGGHVLAATVAATASTDNVVATEQDLLSAVPDAPVGNVFVKVRKGVSDDRAQTDVDRITAGHPELEVAGTLQYKSAIATAIDSMLLVVAGLLGVAVLIAVFGIANTLALSVLERTRESGVLRALGLTRGQLRAMFSGEAVLMAVVAGVLGVGCGVGFGIVAIRSVVGADSAQIAVPGVRLVVFVVLAAIAGLVASVLPARRAARGSVVAAMAEE